VNEASPPVRLQLPAALNAHVFASENDRHIDVIVESRSGARGSDRERNPDYLPALTLLLERLAGSGASIDDLQVVSRPALALPEDQRRLPFDFPILLSARTNVEALRSRITESQRGVARGPKASTTVGGNNNKRLLLRISRGGQIGSLRALIAVLVQD
jgi:hypothetical protein